MKRDQNKKYKCLFNSFNWCKNYEFFTSCQSNTDTYHFLPSYQKRVRSDTCILTKCHSPTMCENRWRDLNFFKPIWYLNTVNCQQMTRTLRLMMYAFDFYCVRMKAALMWWVCTTKCALDLFSCRAHCQKKVKITLLPSDLHRFCGNSVTIIILLWPIIFSNIFKSSFILSR